jgi:hypothetical protein
MREAVAHWRGQPNAETPAETSATASAPTLKPLSPEKVRELAAMCRIQAYYPILGSDIDRFARLLTEALQKGGE